MPTEFDLAASLGVSGHDLRDARLAEMAFQPSSLDAPLSGQPDAAMLADLLGDEDPQLEHMLAMQALASTGENCHRASRRSCSCASMTA